MENVEIHEFYAYEHYSFAKKTTNRIYRVALGELILARTRQIYTPRQGPDCNSLSGSIGFMDMTRNIEIIPKERAIPFPNPNNVLGFNHIYAGADCEDAETAVIQTIGIEPNFQQLGYTRFLMKKAEEITKEWGLNILVVDMILNNIMKDYVVRLGYQLYCDGVQAVKRLK